ncbi:lysostaphin resistance protein A [Staphylococcus gallinarum]|uniref:CPBP family intramembrane glutamic endopeptidase n=1 Tax=Staphylococcus gallinarum TaxID=1293 RepID=UPI001E4F6217|nr:CPBP family intramembrane glutamic endopeptidase [Staphylococcus gallinarum]MCD8829937.1 lysostaphin resistance protein A [Staphylococcus gallinarum]MDN6413864.1 lysostaphin resistance protein A [Staphylococcus gallinarum]MEB6056085.1 lysostaphin resistance protein A [Staphylococcus gallinarum]
MNTKRIPGFQWAMSIFIFYVIAFALPIILKDFQSKIPFKTFVFEMSVLAPFIAAIICIAVFKHKRAQLGGLKFSLSLKVIERLILALILPLAIFIIAMVSFNVFADSFVLLQSEDLSVSIFSVIIGQLLMAFFVEFGFRSYLQHIVETKISTFFASILVGIMYAIWNINIAFSFEYTLYNLLYSFAFSMIIGELIRSTKGRTIYIATLFHAAMSFGLVFLFNEELGYVFSMKVIAFSTAAVAVVYIILSYIIRIFFYFFTKRNLDEVDDNNYLDHVNEHSDNNNTTDNTQSLDNTATVATSSHSQQSHNKDSALTNDTQNGTQQNTKLTDKQTNDTQTDHIKSDNSEQSATHQQVTHNTLPEDESQQTEQPEIQSTKDADEIVYPESTTETQQSKTQSAVETTTERANHDDEQHDGELKQSARYKSDRKSSAVSEAQASIAQDEQSSETSSIDEESTHNERSSFNLKSKRGHRR